MDDFTYMGQISKFFRGRKIQKLEKKLSKLGAQRRQLNDKALLLTNKKEKLQDVPLTKKGKR